MILFNIVIYMGVLRVVGVGIVEKGNFKNCYLGCVWDIGIEGMVNKRKLLWYGRF